MASDGRALVVQADALPRANGRGGLPLPDESVDLIVTSPPFWNLRDYGVPGQIGNEPTRQEFLEHLWRVTAECKRVMKPTASLFLELGDSYATRYSSQRGAGRAGLNDDDSGRGRSGQNRTGSPEKSLNLTPQRYAIGCIDQLGLTLRAEIILNRLNGLPESVRDRVRMSHSRMYHLVKSPRYYSAVDELREPHSGGAHPSGNGQSRQWVRSGTSHRALDTDPAEYHPLGKLPGSVWPMTSEPLDLPGYFVMEGGRLLDFLAPQRGGNRPRPNGHHPSLFDADAYLELVASGDGPAWRWLRATGVNCSPWPRDDTALQLRVAASHYAAFPSRLPELVIKGFSPPGICVACGDGRWPVVDREIPDYRDLPANPSDQDRYDATPISGGLKSTGLRKPGWRNLPDRSATILGYACRCTPFTDHPGTGERDIGDEVKWSPDGQNPRQRQVGGHLANAPRVGPWREYHLSGWQAPPTRPAVVLDPFSGVGTTCLVAKALGRHAIGIDLSHAYNRAARWRIFDSDHAGKAISRTNLERQGHLL